MAHERCLFLLSFLLLLSEFSHCAADSEDSFAWDVKDATKFGVADSNIEVSSLVHSALFCFIYKVNR